MKYRVILLILIQVFVLAQLDGQDRSPESYFHIKGSHQFNLAVGTLNTEQFAFNLFGGTGAGDPSPSLNMEYLYGITDQFAIGLHTNYYRVNARQTFAIEDIQDLIDDPLCVISCQTGINLGNCDCNTVAEARVNALTIAAKGAIHFLRFENLDTYSSFIIGYSFNRQKSITESLLSSALGALDFQVDVPKVIYSGSAGVRYYFDPKIAAYVEYGLSNVHTLRIGATYRIYK